MKKTLLFMFLVVSFITSAQTPSIQSVSPNTGNLGQRLQVTITGENTNFLRVSDTYNVFINNTLGDFFEINAIDMVSNTVLIADVTIPPAVSMGSYNLSVYDQWNGSTDLVNAFTVTDYYNTITGNVGYDLNGNGCGASDMPRAGIKVKMNDGISDSFAFTNSTGDYVFYVPAGNFVVTPEIEGSYFSLSPPSATINFSTTSHLNQTQNFCLSPNGVHNDVEISVLPYDAARPGFDARYRLVYKNNGSQTMNGTVNFVFDGARLDFVSSSTMPDSQTANNLNWNYANLLPFESRTINITLNVNSPMETPAVNNGDILPFTATVNPILGDETPNDNTTNYNQIVVGSYDPNDKTVTEGSEVDITKAGDYLHYLIRFQNSGTFAAEKVVVKDMLPPNLDKSSLEITASSHPYRSSLTAGNQLEFFFDNINLPPEITNEPASHGFIAFKIKPSNNVTIGSVIENTAQIYFDFNFPIVTNTVATTFSVLANHNFGLDEELLLYPNPVGNVLNIKFKSSFENASVKIFNQLGQLVKIVDNIANQADAIAMDDLKNGSYIIQITTNKGTTVKKLIKY